MRKLLKKLKGQRNIFLTDARFLECSETQPLPLPLLVHVNKLIPQTRVEEKPLEHIPATSEKPGVYLVRNRLEH